MLPIHPISDLFAPMSQAEYDGLRDSIRQHGVREPIVVYQGQIIDGRHRARACDELGIDCPTVEWSGQGSMVDFVLDLNLHRRSLTASQRAAIAADALPFYEAEAKARLATSTGGAIPRPKVSVRVEKGDSERTEQAEAEMPQAEPRRDQARDHAAKTVGAKPRLVSDAKAVKAARPDLHEKIKAGELTVGAAKKIASKRPPVTFTTIKDERDRPVTDPLARLAFGGDEIKEIDAIVNDLHALKRRVLAVCDNEAGPRVGRMVARSRTEATFKNLIAELTTARPYTTCPARDCDKLNSCKSCEGTRWVTRAQWNNMPKGIRGE